MRNMAIQIIDKQKHIFRIDNNEYQFVKCGANVIVRDVIVSKTPEMDKSEIYIGIDTGTNTGVAVYVRREKRLAWVETMPIHKAMDFIRGLNSEFDKIFVRFEDARKRKWFGNAGRSQLQGAGSIKRDCSIWEAFLKDERIPFEAVAPKNNKTKMKEAEFKRLTGWTKRTSSHARDAAWLVYGF